MWHILILFAGCRDSLTAKLKNGDCLFLDDNPPDDRQSEAESVSIRKLEGNSCPYDPRIGIDILKTGRKSGREYSLGLEINARSVAQRITSRIR